MKKKITCLNCKGLATCCRMGAWVDLDEAKKILGLGIKGGDFFHLEKDGDYPSGYRGGTCIEDERCSFLTSSGLCSIHKRDYSLKPTHCKEFPYEKEKLSPLAQYLCVAAKPGRRKKKR